MSATLTSAMKGKARVIVLMLAALLAGCSSLPDAGKVSLRLPQPNPASSKISAAEQREHLRILASYGGLYDEARVQKMVESTVQRLAAASTRPDLKYRVTILNSPAVNAFALPNGHLYVTRGLIVLGNDQSELASVLAHEMGHVIAHHAQIREQKARQAALISHVVSDVLSDPQVGALALAKSKLALASFSRTQEFEADAIGIKTSAHAGFDPYGAARFLTDMQRNADLKSGTRSGIEARMADFLSDHPSTPDRVRKALIDAREFSGPGIGQRDRNDYLATSTAWSTARTRAKASCAAAASCIPSSASPSWRRPASRSTTRRRRCSASRTAATKPCASTWSACRPSSRWRGISIPAGSKASTRRACARSRSTASRPRPPRPAARTGRSGCSPCASAATSIASSSRPRP